MVPRNPMASHDPTVPHDPDAAAGEPDRRAEPGPVDWDHLRAVTLADPALQREVLGLFLGQSRDILAAVKGLPDDTAALAHTMKGAARAIGVAMGRNSWPLIVPCHRVLGANGWLGGFSAPGGTVTKKALLAREGVWPDGGQMALFE